MDRISPEIVAKVDAIVRKKLSGMQGRLRITGGPKTIAQMLNHIDRSTEKQIFESLNRKDEALLQDVKRLMLLFEDLVALDDKAVQQVLREIDMNDLAMALKGAPAELKKLIQRNLSKRAAERLVEEAELMGPKPRSDVDAAQQRIVAVVRRLEEEGKISLGARAGGNDELVA
jgi:flagellar motor switch protein FliG